MPNDLTPQGTISVSSWARPKRVAFLVDPGHTNDNEINQIIRYCVGRWGGRFNGIFPTTGAEIPSQWWKAMVLLDPDVVYSFVPLDKRLIWHINRYILPYRIFDMTPGDREQFGGRNLIHHHDIGAIDVEPLPHFVWASRARIWEPFFLNLKESSGNTPDETFILRNFGTLPGTMAMDAAFRDTPHEAIDCRGLTAMQILEKVASHGARTVAPIDLCSMGASFPQFLEYEPFTSGFHLVIGDSPYDVMYAWNRALSWEKLMGRASFWLPQSLADDEEISRSLSAWIGEIFWEFGHERRGKVISYSLGEDQMRRVAEKLTGALHFFFEPVRLTPEQFPFPSARVGGRHAPRYTEQVPLSENKALVGFPRPPFVDGGHPQLGWMVDFEIQHRPERYSYINIRPHWDLPKRLGIADKFFHPHRESRVVSGGLPCAAVVATDRAVGIRIPSDRELVWTYLEPHSNLRRRRIELIPLRFSSLSTSDKGKYLRGLIQLFGNLYSCGSSFEDPFWRDTFLFMAGKPVEDLATRRERAGQVLADFFAADPEPVTCEGPRLEQLAESLARRLLFRDPSAQVLTKGQLRSRFGQLRGDALKAQGDTNYWQAHAAFDERKDQEFNDLVGMSVLHQGAEAACPHCGSRNWYSVEDLKSEMRCVGCFSLFPLRPELIWSYRLNDLVRNALRYHGTLAVLQALYTIERDLPMGMFLFLPCQNIYEKEGSNPFTDLDLVFIKGGKFVIGEVKSEPSAFEEKDFVKIGEVAEELQPDQVLFAAPGETWPDDVKARVTALMEKLAPLEIEVRALPLRWL